VEKVSHKAETVRWEAMEADLTQIDSSTFKVDSKSSQLPSSLQFYHKYVASNLLCPPAFSHMSALAITYKDANSDGSVLLNLQKFEWDSDKKQMQKLKDIFPLKVSAQDNVHELCSSFM